LWRFSYFLGFGSFLGFVVLEALWVSLEDFDFCVIHGRFESTADGCETARISSVMIILDPERWINLSVVLSRKQGLTHDSKGPDQAWSIGLVVCIEGFLLKF
jgi:hypothetical protein